MGLPQEKPKQRVNKSDIIRFLKQEVGGLDSYWNPHKKEELEAIAKYIQEDKILKVAIAKKIDELREARKLNSKLNGKALGQENRANSFKLKFESAVKELEDLSQQYEALLILIREIFASSYEQSEIVNGAKKLLKIIDQKFKK